MEKVRRCILTIPHLHPRSPVSISGHTPTHPDNSVATTIRVGPTPGARAHMKPHWSGPGMVRALRTSSCPLPDAPHLTAPVPPLNLVDRRMDLLCHCSSWLWRPGRRGGRTCPWPGGPVSRRTCGSPVDGRVIVSTILRTFARPSTSIHKVASVHLQHISIVKNTRHMLDLVRGAIPRRADGHRRADWICRSDGIDLVLTKACLALSRVRWPYQVTALRIACDFRP